jgi:hypothetical protein
VVFPPADELAQLPALPAPAEAFSVDALAVDEWGATSAPASSDDEAAYDDASPWGDLARTLVSTRRDTLRLSPALRCAASEMARFYATKRALPTESLRRYVVAQCGGSMPDTVPIFYTIDAPPAVTDAALLEHAKGPIDRLADARLRTPGHAALGVAASRAGNHVAIVVVVGSDEVRLAPSPRRVDADRRVLVRGRLLGQAAQAIALINVGDYRTSACEADPQAALPDFAFSCQAPAGSFVVAVAHHRVKGAAWGQYVVVYLLVQGALGPGVET